MITDTLTKLSHTDVTSHAEMSHHTQRCHTSIDSHHRIIVTLSVSYLCDLSKNVVTRNVFFFCDLLFSKR